MQTSNTTRRAMLTYPDMTGKLVLSLARVLDNIVQGVDVDFSSRWEEDRHKVQKAEALWAAHTPWLWADITRAHDYDDLAALAHGIEETARAKQDDGRGWQAEVWEAIAALIRQVIAYGG